MKKETLADKLAKKSFMSEAVQKSWKVHMDAFAPILDPAFQEDYQSRIHLAAALNHIANRNLDKGFAKLKKLENACVCDADRAAWLYFMGLCFEFAGVKEAMIDFYQQANSFEHDFYLPYMKVAKTALEDCVYEVAETNYNNAIRCLEMSMLDSKNQLMMASAYCNLSSCLIMMHRFTEAEEKLEFSKRLLPYQKGRSSVEAVLYAAKGEKAQAEELMADVKKDIPEAFDKLRAELDKIYEERHPQFFEVEVEKERLTVFWNWFVKEEKTLLQYIESEEFDTFFSVVQAELKKIFPFVEKEVDFAIEPKENGYGICFADYYMKSLAKGYADLIAACPETVKTNWDLKIVH